MLIHNFFEIIFWFAGTYVLLQVMQEKESAMAITQSFLQMIAYNIDVGEGSPTVVAVVILQLQAIIGVFMTILSLARFSSLFPKPDTKDASEKEDHVEEKLNELLKKVEQLEKKFKKLIHIS